jgi:hypothetical protein
MPSSSSRRRPFPQATSATSSVGGKLVPLSVDYNNDQHHNHHHHHIQNEAMPTLVPLSMATEAEADADGEEKTMLWTNIATLFTKCEQNEEDIRANTRGSDEMYQELMEIKGELAQVQGDMADITENNMLSVHVRKLRKYVNKKCSEVRENASYGSHNANIEIFAYIDKLRGEFDARIKKLECENVTLHEEIDRLHETYDRDYDTFVKRENDLMAKLETAIHTTECLNDRVKDYEDASMRQIYESRNCVEQQIQNTAGDLREEFARAICRELAHVSGEIRDEIREEYTNLVTVSNQCHSHRYFGTVEDVKQIRENLQTLKQSIGMVDAELSDTKETVEFLKDEVGQASNDIYDIKEDSREVKETLYREMDRDYRDMKSYVKRSIQRHRKQEHSTTPLPEEEKSADQNQNAVSSSEAIQMIVNEYANANANANGESSKMEQEREYEHNHIIIIDENTVFSDEE